MKSLRIAALLLLISMSLTACAQEEAPSTDEMNTPDAQEDMMEESEENVSASSSSSINIDVNGEEAEESPRSQSETSINVEVQ